MFWQKEKPVVNEGLGLAEKVALEAEGFYRSGRMNCAEAALMAVKNNFRPEIPDSVVEMAGGFGGGSGTGCLCGAVVGGTMAIGLVIPNDKRQVSKLTQELHHWFKSQYGLPLPLGGLSAAPRPCLREVPAQFGDELSGRIAL